WSTYKTTQPFYLHVKGDLDDVGYPWMGAMWYRLSVDVPASAAGKKVLLYVPTIEGEAWAWVNGKYVGHKPYHEAYERPTNDFEVDVTAALKPGQKNVVVFRVHTGLNAAQAAGGMMSRAFLYSPRP